LDKGEFMNEDALQAELTSIAYDAINGCHPRDIGRSCSAVERIYGIDNAMDRVKEIIKHLSSSDH